MRASSLEASNRVMRATPLLPCSSACQFFSVPVPRAVISPVPVTTTRRFDTTVLSSPPGLVQLLLVRVDVVDGVPDGLDVLRFLVRDLDLELLLHRHHQLHDVQAVGAKVLDEEDSGLISSSPTP